MYYQCFRCFSYHLLHYTITANKLGQNGKWYVYNHVRYSIKLTQIGGKIPLGTTVRSYPHCSTYYCCVVLQTHINLIYIETGLKLWLCSGFLDNKALAHGGQNSKQIIIAKYVSQFLIYGAKMLDKCVKSQKKIFVHCPFLQSQAK